MPSFVQNYDPASSLKEISLHKDTGNLSQVHVFQSGKWQKPLKNATLVSEPSVIEDDNQNLDSSRQRTPCLSFQGTKKTIQIDRYSPYEHSMEQNPMTRPLNHSHSAFLKQVKPNKATIFSKHKSIKNN